MDFAKALTYPFDDDDWIKKLGIAILIQFVPILGQIALQGWSYRTSANVKAGDPTPMSDWDFGEVFQKGLLLFLGYLLYQIPLLIFVCIMSALTFLPALSGGNSDALAALGGVAAIAVICLSCVMILYGIFAALLFFAAWVRFIDAPQFSTFTEFGDNIALLRNNIGDFGMAILYLLGASLIGSLISSITVGIGFFLLTPFITYFGAHIVGQLAAKLDGGSSMEAVPAV